MSKLKDIIQDRETKVNFLYYRDRELWYQTTTLFVFPVPINDIGNATFLNTDKAIIFMRYIRKHLEYLEKAKLEQK